MSNNFFFFFNDFSLLSLNVRPSGMGSTSRQETVCCCSGTSELRTGVWPVVGNQEICKWINGLTTQKQQLLVTDFGWSSYMF